MSGESAGTRWWENYLVRYFLPSLAGMVIIRWLDINSQGALSQYIPIFLLSDWKDFGTAHLITWLLFGSLYCYIASYPILVFHATRVLDFKDMAGTANTLWVNPYLHSVIFVALTYIAAWKSAMWLAFISVLMFTCLQLVRLYRVLSTERFGFKQGYDSSIAYAYLNALSKRRGVKQEQISSEDDEGGKSSTVDSRLTDLADSYKHLREHGNTAFIFLLELALCPVFYLALRPRKDLVDFAYLSVFLIIWILPSALVHFLGQHLERRYSLFRH